ncbi:MAG: hypothetical protein DI628_07525 [Blastochloris viridis]|uniref:Zinc finger/thioredoxin putative domain-containing protein n=1 Tax=Blastochloris viridis TaxID=1079 RepID=A0A6N4QZQ8_BLAVI|nr:MAG: hypothetical protein DI628_07525 [Blastochloris viridis]
MITVRCPACDAAYQLDDAKLAAGGRKLKCARCKTVWLAQAPQANVAAPVEIPVDTPEAEVPAEVPVAEPVSRSPVVEEAAPAAEPEADVAPPAEDLKDYAREYAVDEVVQIGGWRQWVRGGNAWRSGALGLVLLGLFTGVGVVALKLMPESVRDAEVETVAAPEALSAKVVQPPEGLVLHNVRDEISPVEGEQGGVALTVRGLLANTTSRTLVVPPMHLELLGEDGRVADTWAVSGVSGDMAGGAEQAWTVSLTAPDMTRIRGWRVVFVEDGPAAVSATTKL